MKTKDCIENQKVNEKKSATHSYGQRLIRSEVFLLYSMFLPLTNG